MDRALEGRRALIIGGSSGIGRASAHRLLADGAHVTIAARTGSRLQETADALAARIEDGAARLSWTVCDALSASAVREAVALAAGDVGLDIALSVPGGGSYAPVLGYADDAFGEEIDQNVRPVFLLLKYAGRSMVARGGGSFVAISSTAAIMSSPYLAAYCAAKAAVDQLVRVAADELGRHGVRVNAVRPGLTRTGGTGPLFDTPELFASFSEQQPLERGGDPEDIADAVRFLAGPESSWVTGQCLTVDGGHTIRRFPDLTPMARQLYGADAWDAVQRGEEPE